MLEVVLLQAKEGGSSSVLGAGSVESGAASWRKWLAQGKGGRAAGAPSLGGAHSLVSFQESMDEEGNKCVGGKEPRGVSVSPRLHSLPAQGIVTQRSPRVSALSPKQTTAGRPHAMSPFTLPQHPPSEPRSLVAGPSPPSSHSEAGSSLCSLLGWATWEQSPACLPQDLTRFLSSAVQVTERHQVQPPLKLSAYNTEAQRGPLKVTQPPSQVVCPESRLLASSCMLSTYSGPPPLCCGPVSIRALGSCLHHCRRLMVLRLGRNDLLSREPGRQDFNEFSY